MKYGNNYFYLQTIRLKPSIGIARSSIVIYELDINETFTILTIELQFNNFSVNSSNNKKRQRLKFFIVLI